jgi:hypothetical protein
MSFTQRVLNDAIVPTANARMRRIYYTYRAFESRFAFSLMEMGLGIKDKVLHAGNAIRIM